MDEAEDSGADRLVATLTDAREQPWAETLRQVRRSVDHWPGGDSLEDDFTLLALDVGAS